MRTTVVYCIIFFALTPFELGDYAPVIQIQRN